MKPWSAASFYLFFGGLLGFLAGALAVVCGRAMVTAAPATAAPPRAAPRPLSAMESPLILETTFCRIYRNVDRYGTVLYVAENREGSHGPAPGQGGGQTSFNGCSGIAVAYAAGGAR